MEEKIGNGLRRVVPAEILKIEEGELAVRTPQGVMETEIGRAERARGDRDFGGGIDVLFATEIAAPVLRAFPEGGEFLVEKPGKRGFTLCRLRAP